MSIHPTLRYDDARAAIAFLTTALPLREGEIHTDDAGTVVHVQPPGPFDTGRASVYLSVDDADAAHARAVAAGADVVMGLVDQPYGSREFAVADPEGNVWSVGTYRPTT